MLVLVSDVHVLPRMEKPMSTGPRVRRVSVLLSLLGFLAWPLEPAVAQGDRVWPVKERLVDKDGDKSKDISGIACSRSDGFPRTCLVIDDNRQHAQLLTLEDGELRAGRSVRLIENSFAGKQLELDGEGVAFDNGHFYVIGSHGHPRDRKRELEAGRDADLIRARIAAASQIVRLKIADGSASGIRSTGRLRDAIAAEPALRPFMDRRLENNGLTIEGIAIRNGRLFAGFRGPMLEDGCAAVLSVSLAALFEDQPLQARLHRLRLGDGQGVRDLAAFGNGILVLAGPAGDGGGRYAVYGWDAAGDAVRFLKDISAVSGGDADHKPEAILPLDAGEFGLRLLVLSDGVPEGGPVAIEMPAP
jgi:hypothetical protein